MADDEFWNESQVKSCAKIFSFDDRESGSGLGDSSSLQMCGISLDGTAQLFQQVQAGLRQSGSVSSTSSDTKKATQLELHQLISEKSLNCILDADSTHFVFSNTRIDPAEEARILRRQLEDVWVTPDPRKTAKAMMLKQPFILETFTSLQSKKQLLQEAIALGDGDSILAVVLFLSKTLKRTYFNQILLELPVAATHYAAYLSTRLRTAELTDLLEMLGKSKDASMKQFEVAVQNSGRQLQRLTTCAKNHVFEGKDSQILDNYIKFLEWQNKTDIKGESVVSCLSELCESHWDKGQGSSNSPISPLSPFYLSQQQGVGEKQFQWAAVTARAKRQAWQDIQTLLTSKSWLRGPKLRVSLPIEHVVTMLHSSGAPQELLYTFLLLIENADKRLDMARAVACDRAIIEFQKPNVMLSAPP